MGAEGFHGRVRDGIGCLAPRYGHQASPRAACPWLEQRAGAGNRVCHVVRAECLGEAASGPRWRGGFGFCRCTRGGVGVQVPLERLVPVSCAGCPASTSGLSTWWSSTALGRDLVLRRVSRLDAFSGYPVRT